MSIETYHIGDTVKLSVSFKDFDDEAVDPVGVTLNIYDSHKTKIITYETAALTHTGTGVYSYEYVIPDDYKEYIYEFVGTVGGKPLLDRKNFKAAWLIQD
jgi:hypothetical protein